LNKIPNVLLIAFLPALVLAACTRPASYQLQTGVAGTIPPSTASQSAPFFSAIRETKAPENVVHTPTATVPTLPKITASPTGVSTPVTQIPLSGPIALPEAELSGMAWYGDLLILLPQYPYRFPAGDAGSLFALHRSEILDFIQGNTSEALNPIQIPFYAPGLETSIRGFEGFEAIAIDGDQVFMTIEAHPNGMMGYLVAGKIASDMSEIRMDTARLSQIQPQTGIPNFSDEALLVFGNRLISIYEISGGLFNPHPVAHMFDFSLQLLDTLAFPDIPYRISDATSPDDSGRFWAINFTLRGEVEATTSSGSLLDGFREELSQFETLERLVEFQFSEDGIVLSDTPPILLALTGSQQNSNWEAIARLGELGFLIATDEHPDTILGFVPYP
jgi:hypothetical protein